MPTPRATSGAAATPDPLGMPDTRTIKLGLDYVTLVGIGGLSVVAGIATYLGAENIALTCIGVVGGVMTRLYR